MSRMTIYNWILLSAIGLLSCKTAGANHELDGLRRDFEIQRRAVKQTYGASVDAIKYEYRTVVQQLNGARREAVRLCEPQRGFALDRIKRDRRSAALTYQSKLNAAKQDYRLARNQLQAWYDLTYRQIRASREFTVVPTCTATVLQAYDVPRVYAPSPVTPIGSPRRVAPTHPGFEPLPGAGVNEYDAEILPAIEGPAFSTDPNASARYRQREVERTRTRTVSHGLANLVGLMADRLSE